MAITKINVGMASCGLASGARQVFDKLEETIGDKIPVKRTGCIGVCAFEPIVDLIADNGIIYRYKQVTKKIVQQIVENHIIGGTPIEEYILPERILKSQLRVVMRNTGHSDRSLFGESPPANLRAVRHARSSPTEPVRLARSLRAVSGQASLWHPSSRIAVVRSSTTRVEW